MTKNQTIAQTLRRAIRRRRECRQCEFWENKPPRGCGLILKNDRNTDKMLTMWLDPEAQCLFHAAGGCNMWAEIP